jgi:hypothetical protein
MSHSLMPYKPVEQLAQNQIPLRFDVFGCKSAWCYQVVLFDNKALLLLLLLLLR